MFYAINFSLPSPEAMTSAPRVVCIKKAELKKRGIADFQAWDSDPNHLYIGRNMSFYVPGTLKSKWLSGTLPALRVVQCLSK